MLTTDLQVYRGGRWWWAVPIRKGWFVRLMDCVSFDDGEG